MTVQELIDELQQYPKDAGVDMYTGWLPCDVADRVEFLYGRIMIYGKEIEGDV